MMAALADMDILLLKIGLMGYDLNLAGYKNKISPMSFFLISAPRAECKVNSNRLVPIGLATTE